MINYSSENLAGHFTILADEILTGNISTIGIHTGAELTLDNYKFLLAGSFDNATPNNRWNILVSSEAKFDIFTLAASLSSQKEGTWQGVEVGASIATDITDEIIVKLGGQWDDHNSEQWGWIGGQWKIAVALEAKFTETLAFTGEVGVDAMVTPPISIAYGSAELKWELEDNLKASIKAWGNENGAYSFTFLASKKFK